MNNINTTPQDETRGFYNGRLKMQTLEQLHTAAVYRRAGEGVEPHADMTGPSQILSRHAPSLPCLTPVFLLSPSAVAPLTQCHFPDACANACNKKKTITHNTLTLTLLLCPSHRSWSKDASTPRLPREGVIVVSEHTQNLFDGNNKELMIFFLFPECYK